MNEMMETKSTLVEMTQWSYLTHISHCDILTLPSIPVVLCSRLILIACLLSPDLPAM